MAVAIVHLDAVRSIKSGKNWKFIAIYRVTESSPLIQPP